MSSEATQIDIEKATSYYYDGMSIRDISRIMNIGAYIVRRSFKDHNVKMRERYAYSKKDIDTSVAIEMYDNGKSVNAIAKFFNVSAPVIMRHFREANFETSHNKVSREILAKAEDDALIIVEKHRNGLKIELIAEEYSVGKGIIQRLFRENNYSPMEESYRQRLRTIEKNKPKVCQKFSKKLMMSKKGIFNKIRNFPDYKHMNLIAGDVVVVTIEVVSRINDE